MKPETRYFAIAFGISVLWVGLSGIYTYRTQNAYFAGLSIFPLVLWTLGLVATRKIYDAQTRHPLLRTWIIYASILLAVEAIGYHALHIQLDSQFQGLLGLDVLHVPLYAQAYYLSAGPLFAALTKRIDQDFGWAK